MDDHLIYALTLGLLASLGAGRWLGLGRKWEQTTLVQKVPVCAEPSAPPSPAVPRPQCRWQHRVVGGELDDHFAVRSRRVDTEVLTPEERAWVCSW